MNKKNLLCVIGFILLLMSGCSILNDMWPTRIPKATINYLGLDPNTPQVQMLGTAKEMKSGAVDKHIKTQLELKYEVSVDKAGFDSAMEINSNIEVAEVERQKMIGTIENPGWLLSMLLGGSMLGLYSYGSRQQRPEDYNESEMTVEVEKRVAVELAKLGKV